MSGITYDRDSHKPTGFYFDWKIKTLDRSGAHVILFNHQNAYHVLEIPLFTIPDLEDLIYESYKLFKLALSVKLLNRGLPMVDMPVYKIEDEYAHDRMIQKLGGLLE